MSIKKEEFNEKIFTRINDLINEYELIKEGEKIAIALSGGKDSVLTLHALKNYQDICGFNFELVAFLLMKELKDIVNMESMQQ